MLATPNILTSFLDQTAQSSALSPAAEDSVHRLNFAKMQAAGLRIAGELAQCGVEPGDRVALCMANSVAFCAAFWGCLYAGAIAVPLNVETKPAKLGWIFRDCQPAAIIYDDSQETKIRQCCDDAGLTAALIANGTGRALARLIEADTPWPLKAPAAGRVLDQDLAAIIYTSGSTGDPKGVMLSHLNMTSAARSVAHYLGYTATDRVFCAIPMVFDYGLHQLTMTTLTGACLLVEPSFAQPLFALKRLAASRATVFPVVPTMVPLIAPLADRFDFRAVRTISSTAAALHVAFIDKLTAMFPKARLFSMYGLTECHRCTYLEPSELETRRSSVGKAIPNTELWVLDEAGTPHRSNAIGELVIRGSTVMKGYWNNPAKTAEKLRAGPFPGESVLYTGDTCRLDAEGFVYFISRSDDIVKVGGEKVAPSEIEIALIAHHDVSEVCAMGVEHPVYGQQCCAVVVLHQSSVHPDAAALKAWCATRLEAHAVPARILIVDAMPRNGNGKIDRHVTLEWLQAKATPVGPALLNPAMAPPVVVSSGPPQSAACVAS